MIEDNEVPLHQRTNEAEPKAACVHRFEPHVGVKVFNKKGMAWIQLALVEGGSDDLPGMWICVHCGAEGYVVPA